MPIICIAAMSIFMSSMAFASSWETVATLPDRVLKIDAESIAPVEIFGLKFIEAKTRIEFDNRQIFSGNNQPYDVLEWTLLQDCAAKEGGFQAITYILDDSEVYSLKRELSQVSLYSTAGDSVGTLYEKRLCDSGKSPATPQVQRHRRSRDANGGH